MVFLSFYLLNFFFICFKWTNPRGDTWSSLVMKLDPKEQTRSPSVITFAHKDLFRVRKFRLMKWSAQGVLVKRWGVQWGSREKSDLVERRESVGVRSWLWRGLGAGEEEVPGETEEAGLRGSEVRSDTRGLLYYKGRRTRRSTLRREPKEEDAVHVTTSTVDIQHPCERIWGLEPHLLLNSLVFLLAAWLALLSVCKCWSELRSSRSFFAAWTVSDSGWGLRSIFATWCPLRLLSGGFPCRTCDWSFFINACDPAPDLCSEHRTCAVPPSPARQRVFVILMSLWLLRVWLMSLHFITYWQTEFVSPGCKADKRLERSHPDHGFLTFSLQLIFWNTSLSCPHQTFETFSWSSLEDVVLLLEPSLQVHL